METYLAHHGILGMKWGIRRYQNEDGSLTEAGKRRAMKVESSPFRSRRDTKVAKRILSDNYRLNSVVAETYNKAKETEAEKIERYDKIGDTIRGRRAREKFEKYQKIAQNAVDKNRDFSTLLMNVNDGIVKAGRDFFIQRDWNFNILWLTKESRLIIPDSENSGAMKAKTPHRYDDDDDE